MKLLYILTHQIHNLTPLFRELSIKKDVDFKAIYWQKISSKYFDPEFNKIIDFGIDQFEGYSYESLFNKEKKTYDFSFFFKLKITVKLIKLLIISDYNTIVFHGYRFPHIFGLIIAKLFNKKTIMRSISYNLGKKSLLKKIIRFIYYRFANFFIDEYWTIHNLNEKFFLDFGAKKNKFIFIDHCQGEYSKLLNTNKNLLLNKEEFTNKYDLPNNKKFIFFGGRFIKRKNPEYLYDAFIEANLSNDWFLIMVGNGELKAKIEDKNRFNKLENIKFLDFQDQKSLINFFNYSEILVLPSELGDTHGNIAAEAVQFGCALILSNMVGLRTECIDNKIGLVFDIEKKNELVDHLRLLTNENKILANFQKNAFEFGKTKTPEHAANLIAQSLKL